ncbi:MAG: hypothetical protein QGG40_14935 [Myxococcota bacterium]|nr:hypothetical protein [Myxococcota bacterium]
MLHTPPRTRLPQAALLLGMLCSASCFPRSVGEQRIEPSFIQVVLADGTGSEDEPLTFSSAAQAFEVTVTTLDMDGEPYAFDGDLSIQVRPGHVDMDSCGLWGSEICVAVEDGAWTGDVTIQRGFGPTRIWFSDEGDYDQGRTGSFAAGVSDPIWFSTPTIAMMQEPVVKEDEAGWEPNEHNQLESEYAEIDLTDQQVAVTTVGTDGFWVTDLVDGPDGYGSLFIYTFNKPEDVVEGSWLTMLKGVNQEYLGSTQLSFPTYEVAEEDTLEVPDPVVLDSDAACDYDTMEKHESSIVTLENVSIPASFTAEDEDFAEYDQWAVEFSDGCTLAMESAVTAPDFYPPDYAGESLESVTGMLFEVWGEWVLHARSPDDIVVSGRSGPPRPPATGDSPGPSRPDPRPRPSSLLDDGPRSNHSARSTRMRGHEPNAHDGGSP